MLYESFANNKVDRAIRNHSPMATQRSPFDSMGPGNFSAPPFYNYPTPDTTPYTTTNPDSSPPDSSSGGSKSLPVYVLFLIMLGSGVFTLLLLWVCIQFIYRRRRRRARLMRSNESMLGGEPGTWVPHRDVEDGGEILHVATGESPVGGTKKNISKRQVVEGVELNLVVMAGEEKPTFIALPLFNHGQSPHSPHSISEATSDAGNPNK